MSCSVECSLAATAVVNAVAASFHALTADEAGAQIHYEQQYQLTNRRHFIMQVILRMIPPPRMPRNVLLWLCFSSPVLLELVSLLMLS